MLKLARSKAIKSPRDFPGRHEGRTGLSRAHLDGKQRKKGLRTKPCFFVLAIVLTT
jgi:hypothetical protein